jgi:indole-3-glycerol phosphate synthase
MTMPTTLPEGVLAAGGILDRIVDARSIRLEDAKRRVPLARLASPTSRTTDSFAAALRRSGTNIIAEIKQRSPSKGILRADFDPVRIAEAYAVGGAAALSVLTEEDFFGGSPEHLRAVRNRVDLPLLRKDFLFDEYQIHESASAGADAVLLIVAILGNDLLSRLIGLAGELGLQALIEVHSADEMERAVQAGASIVGVNNRDLTTFDVSLQTSVSLVTQAPGNAVLVSESGIHSGQDIRRLKAVGFNGFLVGEHFMRADSPGDALAQLIEDASA